MTTWLPSIPLPSDWPAHAQLALLHAVALAHFGLTHIRGWGQNSRIPRVRLKGENERLRSELGLVCEQMRIKDARLERIAPANRPHYLPTERLAILELRAARGWNNEQTAAAFLVTAATIASWLARLDEHGAATLVQTPTPVNRFPDFVAHLVQQLKTTLPAMGKVRVAQLLAQAGLQLSASTVARMAARRPLPQPPRPDAPARARASSDGPAGTDAKAPQRTVKANYSNHLWNIDLSVVPTGAGLWTAWLPFALPQCWPFAWWVVAVVDHYSRHVIEIDAYHSHPSEAEVCALLDQAVATAGRPPRYTVTDQGGQFSDGYRAWCKQHGIRPRFGAVGKSGSIALIERFILTLKNECTRRILVPLRLADLRSELGLFVRWYGELRPHQALGGRTPREVYEASKVEPFAASAANDTAASNDGTPLAARAAPADLPRLELRVSYLEGRRHLPIIELERAA
jgi:transposase InsO family protein